MGGKDGTERLDRNAAGIARAAQILCEGGLVALPTETVYGLAARADSDAAVAAIYRAKGRPDFNPLIVHVSNMAQAEKIAAFGRGAQALAEAFWPGPLTLVLPLREGSGIAAAVTAGLPTIAVRCPAHPVMRGVLEASGLLLAAPSANRSGRVSPTTPDHVLTGLGGRIDAVVDGGACGAGVESTIIAVESDWWRLLRPGPVTEADLEDLLPRSATRGTTEVEAPGQLASHYAPGKPVRLQATERRTDEFMIGFGAVDGDVSLSQSGDLQEAAARLYLCLHLAAESDRARVAVAPVPWDGIGAAINDRLKRAAA